MGSIDKKINLDSLSHGFDDIGFAQATGTISSARQYKTGKWAKYALMESAAAHGLTKGQAINISNTTDYDGPTRVVDVTSPTGFVIKRAFSVTKTGNWDLRTVEGNWDGIIPLDNATGSTNITFEFWKPGMAAGLQPATALTKDEIYSFPGLKKVTINSSGNLRLIRAASVRPGDGINKNAPTVVAYSPPTAAIGATLDILGSNFDPIADRNSVQFLTSPTAGVYAKVTNATEEILTVVIPDGVAATGVISVKANGGQNASGPVFTRG